jgi:hypothetical protein
MNYSKQTERFVATANMLVVILIIVWKTVGLNWLPLGLGDAWVRTMDPSEPYYPRHNRRETEYNFFYLLFYGIFGLWAQWSSLKLVSNPYDKLAKNVFGAFHASIAVYHILFAMRIIEGKSLLLNISPSYGKYFIQVVYLLCFVVALDFFLKPYDVRRKTSLDLLSFFNITPPGAHMIILWIGLESETVAYFINGICLVVIPFILSVMETRRILFGLRVTANGREPNKSA